MIERIINEREKIFLLTLIIFCLLIAPRCKDVVENIETSKSIPTKTSRIEIEQSPSPLSTEEKFRSTQISQWETAEQRLCLAGPKGICDPVHVKKVDKFSNSRSAQEVLFTSGKKT